MTHLEIIKEAFDKCGIEYKIFPSDDDKKWEYLITVGYDKDRYGNLTSDEKLRQCRYFFEFLNGKIASY